MTETQKRIEAYQKALPGIKEKVAAVATLLALSVIMLTSASFAWLTISRAPEVTQVATNVAANGNLEIALATGTGTEAPGESQVGDSSATKGQSVTAANITWGNLVNLNDPSYGLDHLALRPAQLNTAALLVSPLYGAMYDGDGRITQLDSSFAYATWNQAEGDKEAHFAVSENFGVRAISSTKIEAVGAAATYQKMLGAAKNTNLAAANMYANLGNNNDYMQSLATMMGLFMTARMNPSNDSLNNPDVGIEDLQNLRDMYADFLECFDKEAEAIAALLNLQLFLKHGEGKYTPYTVEMIYETTTAELEAAGLSIGDENKIDTLDKNKKNDLDRFVSDRNTILNDYQIMVNLCSSGQSLKWQDTGISTIVNNLVNVNECTVGGTPIKNIGASNAMGYLSGTQEARITNGILYRFEQRVGGYIEVKNLSISATVERSGITVPATVKANIQTTAPRDYNIFNNDLTYTESLNTGEYQGGTAVAKETYGLAVDLWVRTNAEQSYLTLEGNVLTHTERDVPVTGKDSNGNTVEIYTLSRTEEIETEGEDGTTSTETVTYSFDLYKKETKDEDGNVTSVTWYKAEEHTVFALEDGEEPRRKVEDVVTIVGYEGDNRIWSDVEAWETNPQGLSLDSTTQGSGSCYVYYADTPEDQARSLKLLEAFKVAFVDSKGKLLATALMDTEQFFAESGRVTVPLVLDTSNSINLGEDYQGNINYAITALEKNVPMRITAIVYLDGTKLTNQEVLAASEIQGQLNIQFGSSEALEPIENEDLSSKERRVSASIDKTNFDYDTATEPMTTNVTVYVDGDEPQNVTAFFIRAISSTQGSREEKMTFNKNADGDWVSSYTFTAPGNYILRSVQLDGVEYDLETPPTVAISGFAITSLSCREATGNTAKIMTALNSGTVNLELGFATGDKSKMPTTVQGRYIKEEDGSAVNVNFTLNANTGKWTGSATFLSSGTYKLQYVLLDGEYTELSSGLWQTAEVTLGMRVAVYTTSPHLIVDDGEELPENERLLGMQVKILDDAGNEILGLSGAKLTYGMRGSGTNKMDTDLDWDGTYYIGNLQNSLIPGVWQFSNVTVGGNTLSVATTSPTFTIRSVSPSNFYKKTTVAYQYAANKDAVMDAHITNSSALATDEGGLVYALIIKEDQTEEQGTWVEGVIANTYSESGRYISEWTFTVPQDANGYQDGNWKMIKLSLGEVYDSEGNYYTAEEPRIIDISDEENTATVVNRIKVEFPTEFLTGEINFGKTGETITGEFMQSHDIENLGLKITDQFGNPLDEKISITDVKLIFTYKNGTSGTYGSYTSSELNNTTEGATIKVVLEDEDGDGAFTQVTTDDEDNAIEHKLIYAGEYYSGLLFKVNGAYYAYGDVNGDGKIGTANIAEDGNSINVTEQDMISNMPEFKVWSKAPTITISSVSTNAASARFFTTTTPSSYDHVVTGLKNWKSDNGYSASVFIYVDGPSSATKDVEVVTLKYPTINLSLEGLPTDHDGVTLVVPNGTNSSYSNTFTFESGKTTASSSIGAGENGVYNEGFLTYGAGVETWPKFYPVGKQTIRTINVSYGDMDFVMTLSHAVNISQTTLPPYAELVVGESTYSGATKIYSEDTENVVLSKMEWTTTGIEMGTGTKVSDWSKKTLHTDHGYKMWTGWFIIQYTEERYMPFYWTEFSRTITGNQRSYTTTYTINKWIVNGKEYDVSKNAVSFKVTGSIQATAVVTVTTVYGDWTETTTTEVKYGYLAGSQQKGNPGGTQIGATVNSEDGTYENPSIGLANTSTLANMYDDKDKYLECTNRG